VRADLEALLDPMLFEIKKKSTGTPSRNFRESLESSSAVSMRKVTADFDHAKCLCLSDFSANTADSKVLCTETVCTLNMGATLLAVIITLMTVLYTSASNIDEQCQVHDERKITCSCIGSKVLIKRLHIKSRYCIHGFSLPLCEMAFVYVP